MGKKTDAEKTRTWWLLSGNRLDQPLPPQDGGSGGSSGSSSRRHPWSLGPFSSMDPSTVKVEMLSSVEEDQKLPQFTAQMEEALRWSLIDQDPTSSSLSATTAS